MRATLISLARENRLGKETVRECLVDAGVRTRRQGLENEQAAYNVCKYKEGLTVCEIAREVGVGNSMVWRTLKKGGVKLRSRSQPTNTN